MKQLLGCYDLQTGTLWDESSEVGAFKNQRHVLRIFGHVCTPGGADNDMVAISELLQQYGTRITEHVGGMYILLWFDKVEKVLRVFHDRSTSAVAFYYVSAGGKLYYSTSIKALLLRSRIHRELNEVAIEEFLINGYLYGRQTLIKQVEKLEAFHYLHVGGSREPEQVAANYSLEQMTAGQALDRWKPTLDRAVARCYAGETEINAPLSSGYDSSYIVDAASKNSGLPINAFSIGGKFGKNELPQVEENVKQYKSVTLHTALTDGSTLGNLPDIVWRLEGAVYENGIFLQYELARLAQQAGKRFLICGECADQVLSQWYLEEGRIHPSKEGGKPMYFDFSEYPYIFGNSLILKKNGIMANSFDIETRYPYLDDAVVAVANALRGINGTDKRCHTVCCQAELPEKVLANISKIGGATECHSLFNSPREIGEFEKRIENSTFYRNHRQMLERTRHMPRERLTGGAAVKHVVRSAVLNTLRIGVEGRRKGAYFFQEMKLRDYLCYAYVILFQKLILSGDYDEYFCQPGIQTDLTELL